MTCTRTGTVWCRLDLDLPTTTMAVVVIADERAVTGLRFGTETDQAGWLTGAGPAPGDHPVVTTAASQLRSYAAGGLDRFDLPLRLDGTPFQRDVWSALLDIPYGTTVTYGWLAGELGRPGSARAVGAAVGSNPIGIVVPCHRVIGASGALTGFGGGLVNKAALLVREGIAAL